MKKIIIMIMFVIFFNAKIYASENIDYKYTDNNYES